MANQKKFNKIHLKNDLFVSLKNIKQTDVLNFYKNSSYKTLFKIFFFNLLIEIIKHHIINICLGIKKFFKMKLYLVKTQRLINLLTKDFKVLTKFYSFNSSYLIFYIFLFNLINITYSQKINCPNAKQINGLKPLNVNLNCDCSQLTDQSVGWDIFCYSIESLHTNPQNETSSTNSDFSTLTPSVDRTDLLKENSELVEEMSNDNLSSSFGEKNENEKDFFAERLTSGSVDYVVDDLSMYRSVPIAFSIKYVAHQLISIECLENVPNFKPAMFQDFKVDEIDAFKISNCVLPDIPFNILFHRINIQKKVPNIRSLKLETLHTQSIDLNQFKKLFVNLEFLEVLTIDNYELDLSGKGLRMKRQLPFSRSNVMFLNNNFNNLKLSNIQQNITNSQSFLLNKMHRNNILKNGNTGQNFLSTTINPNRFKPNGFVTPSTVEFIDKPTNNLNSRLINVRATNNHKPSIENLATNNSIFLQPKNDQFLNKPKNEQPVNIFKNDQPNIIKKDQFDKLKNFDTSTTSSLNLRTSNEVSKKLNSSNLINLTRNDIISTTQSSILNLTSISEINENLTSTANPIISNFTFKNDSLVSLENYNLPNRMKTPLLTNMMNKRNNTNRNLNRNLNKNSKKLNLSFANYFPSLKILKIRSFLTNYDKDNPFYLKELLNGLNSLELIEFSKNIIQNLPSSMFINLNKLKYLNLNHNQIQSIDKDTFFNLNLLETLELENNELKELNEDVFKWLINLNKIKLKRNKFQELPETLFLKNINLNEIDLSQNNQLTILPDNLLKNLNQLKNLSIFDCQLLQISNNSQKFFSNSPNLNFINMRNNRLKYLNMKSLFHNNNKLVKLDLAYNDITYISSDIFSTNSSSLIELNLYANNLIEIPINLFNNLKNLRVLNLGFNNLTEIDFELFYSLINLEELDLSKNLLETINPKQYPSPFGISNNLRSINLSNNKLSSFKNEFGVINWSLYLMLTDLNLSFNKLNGEIELPVFKSNKMKLDLRSNLIETINIDELELNDKASLDFKIKNDKSEIQIFLANNPINCDCRLFNFINYIRSFKNYNKYIFDLEYLECQKPDKLNKILIEQLNDSDLTCLIKNDKLCPKICECQYISKYHQVEIDCQDKLLNKPPVKVLLMSNYENINLIDRQKLKSNQIDLITLNFQHNNIKKLDDFNLLFYKNNTIRKRSVPLNLELFLDNNTINEITDNFLNISKNFKNNDQQNFKLKTLSLTNNNLQYIPVEFLDKLVDLNNLTMQQSKEVPELKLYLSSNPFNCTPSQQLIKNSLNDKKMFNEQEGCYIKEMKNWFTKNYNYIGDLGDIFCINNLNKNGTRKLIQYTDEQLCPRELDDKSGTFLLLYTCIIVSLLLFIFTIFYFKNRQTILAFVYIHIHPVFVCLSFNEEDLDKEKLYDAFVSYSSQDRDVVMQLIEHLEKPSKQTSNSINYLQSKNGFPTFHEANADKIVPDVMSSTVKNSNSLKVPASLKHNSLNDYSNSSLNNQSNSSQFNFNSLSSTFHLNSSMNSNDLDENSDYFKLCIHERDWLPGQLISWNIINSVRNSRRTILILSKNFIESIWFQIEFHTAYYQMLEDKMDRLIVIVKGDLPDKEHLDKDLAFLLSTKTYLVWGEKWFWEKLRYSLPHKKPLKENKLMKPLMNGNNLKLQDFGTYSNSSLGLNSLTNRNTLYSNKLSSKAKYMQECVDNAIADYYKLNKNNTSNELSDDDKRKNDSYDLNGKLKTSVAKQNEINENINKNGHVNQSFENETET